MTGHLAMGANKITGLANGTADTDAATLAQTGWRLLATKTASASSTIDFTSADYDFSADGFDDYMIAISNAKFSVDDTILNLRIGTGATPTWQSGAGAYNYQLAMVGSTSVAATTGTAILCSGDTAVYGATNGVGNASGENYCATILFSNPDSGDSVPFYIDCRYIRASGVGIRVLAGGAYGTATALTAIRFLPDSGNITSGKFRLYGLKK